MSDDLGKRSRRTPTKFNDAVVEDLPGQQVVYRLLDEKDVTADLVDREVHVLWPDDGTWYAAIVQGCTPRTRRAKLYYQETDELEDADLHELISEGWIAFKEGRPEGHVLLDNEVGLGAEYNGRKRPISERPPPPAKRPAKPKPSVEEEEEEEDSEEDAGARVDDSDPSVSSGDLAGGRKRRRGDDDSDDDYDEEKV